MDKKVLVVGAIAALSFLVGASIALGVHRSKSKVTSYQSTKNVKSNPAPKRSKSGTSAEPEAYLVVGVTEDGSRPEYDWIQLDAAGVAAAYSGVVASSKVLEEALAKKATTWPRHGWALDVRDGQLHALSLNQNSPGNGGPKIVDFGSVPRRSGVWVWGVRPTEPLPGHIIVPLTGNKM
jgi:hypothetical protein